MSRFPSDEPKEEPQRIVGTLLNGAFECDICYEVTTTAINSRREEKLYWTCPQGHENSINFKL
jgi:hypothetical protein